MEFVTLVWGTGWLVEVRDTGMVNVLMGGVRDTGMENGWVGGGS